MKKILLTTLLAVCSSSIATALPFQEMIGEDVELFVSIRSLTDLREQWSEHPMAEIFKDESLIELFDHLSDSEEAEAESAGFFEEMENIFGLSEDEFFELFPGQVSLAFYNVSDQLLQNDERMELTLMTEFSGDAERLDELMQIQFERNAEMQKAVNPLVEHEMVDETFMGETLYFDETFDGETTYVEDGYALVDGILVLATPESRLREAVEIIKEGAETSISSSGLYKRSREHSGRGDVGVYLNLVELMPPVNATLGKLPIYGALTLFGITSQSLESALSLESIEGFFLDFDIVPDGVLGYSGILYSEKSGLLSLFEYVDGELPEARYVPDNVLNSSITLFDLSAMYSSLEEMLSTASPHIVSMLDIQMQTIQADTGVDLRAGMLENFGTQIVGFSILKEDATNAVELFQPQQVLVIDLKNAEAFSQALNALIDSAQQVRPLIKESAFEGETIYSIVVPNEPTETEINYAITRSKFILTIGHISLLHNVLSEMGQESDGFWQDPDVLALFERIEQPNAVTRAYYDVEQLIEPFFKMLAAMNRFGDASETLKSTEIPQSLRGAYRLFSEANEAPGGFFGRTLIIKSEGGE
ncbi:MAG: hypothetical protein ACJAT5_000466 [Lentimonas sp.]|jgi:hypothetical protein